MGKECCGGGGCTPHPVAHGNLVYGKKLPNGNHAYEHPDVEKTRERIAEAKKIRAEVSGVRLKDQERFLEEELLNTRAKLGKKNVDWAAKYLELQRETAQEAARWGRRYEELEEVYKEQLEKVKEEFDEALEEGYEEAYHLLLAEKQKNKLLEEELEIAKQNLADAEKVAEQGYAEAYSIIQDMRDRLENQKEGYEAELNTQTNVLLGAMQAAEDAERDQELSKASKYDDFTKGDGEVGGK